MCAKRHATGRVKLTGPAEVGQCITYCITHMLKSLWDLVPIRFH